MEKKVCKVIDSAGRHVEAEVSVARMKEIENALRMHPQMANDSPDVMAFAVSQLAYTEATVYEREYQDTQWRQFLPITAEAGPDAGTVRYQTMDKMGKGRRISPSAKDIPMAEVSGGQVEKPIYHGGAGYMYTLQELREAARMIRPLPTARMETAVEMFERHMNDVALYGEERGTSAGVDGLFNYTGVNATAISGFTGSWANPATTAEQILADVNGALLKVWNDTSYRVLPDTLIAAPAAFTPLVTRARTTQSDTTLINFIKKNSLLMQIKGKELDIQPGFGLDTAGAGSATRCVYFEKNPKRLVMHVPMPIRFVAPQPEGLHISVPGEYRYAGVEIRYIKSVLYQDGC